MNIWTIEMVTFLKRGEVRETEEGTFSLHFKLFISNNKVHFNGHKMMLYSILEMHKWLIYMRQVIFEKKK